MMFKMFRRFHHHDLCVFFPGGIHSQLVSISTGLPVTNKVLLKMCVPFKTPGVPLQAIIRMSG